MEYRKLGRTDVDVSVICLGTMSYGEQNSEKEAHEQLDYSVDQGINFIDTAEMYAIPPKKETCGKTEDATEGRTAFKEKRKPKWRGN